MVPPELLLVEKGIPLTGELFGFFERIIQYDPAEGVENHPRRNQAAALLIRSSTKIRPGMESAFPNLKIVGTTTAGYDHISPWPGLEVVNAPGCNAEAVADYVCYALFAGKDFADDLFKGTGFGVIGLGEAGSRVAERMEKLGFSVRSYDPPKAERTAAFQSETWEELLKCRYISIHTPLTYDGKFPTYNMLNRRFFEEIRSGTVLINCARGGVLDEEALLKHQDKLRYLILDVYKNEPRINPDLLSSADIATPHIAGYSSQAFVRGAIQVADSFRAFWGKGKTMNPERYYQTEKKCFPEPLKHLEDTFEFLEKIFSIRELSEDLKRAGKLEPGRYLEMRAQAIRSENSFIELNLPANLPEKVKEVLAALNLARIIRES